MDLDNRAKNTKLSLFFSFVFILYHINIIKHTLYLYSVCERCTKTWSIFAQSICWVPGPAPCPGTVKDPKNQAYNIFPWLIRYAFFVFTKPYFLYALQAFSLFFQMGTEELGYMLVLSWYDSRLEFHWSPCHTVLY